MSQDYQSQLADYLALLLEKISNVDEEEVGHNVRYILDSLVVHPKTNGAVLKWASSFMMNIFASQITALVKRDTGLHFTAKKTTEERLHEFDIDSLGLEMCARAPDLWNLLGVLLATNTNINYKCEWRKCCNETSPIIPRG